MKKASSTSWLMSDEQRELFPAISGNEINGLGETKSRRPKIVYWPNDSKRNETKKYGTASEHPFGEVINWFRSQSPAITHVYTDFENRAPKTLDPVADIPVEDTEANWTARVKEFVLENEGNLVGITKLNSDWFYDDAEVPELPWVVVIGGKMDFEKVKHVPPSTDDPVSGIEVGEVYNQVDRAAGKLANWIRGQGWYGENQGGPSSGKMTLIPAALECGFGELGKHGSIINRELGSMLRLSVVRTDLPLLPDCRDIFGADDFCMQCQVCSNACPVDAIGPEKQMIRGEQKWYVNFDKCVPYFNENYACGICIAVCPWSRPGVAPKMAERMTRRKARKGQQ
jgi:ferredoxin